MLGIRACCCGRIRSDIFVETADPRLEDLTRDFRELTDESHPDHLLIHHFSIGSKASRVAYALPDRMVIVYHNITPPQYFADVHKLLVRLCYHGRRELGAYVHRCDLALGDSEFNCQELAELGFPVTGVLPVVPGFSHLDGPAHDLVARQFDDGWTNILFVGRIIPNKRIENLIRFFAAYKTRYNPHARLLIVGSYGGFERYLTMLHELVAQLRVPDVHFTGHVSTGVDGLLRHRRRVPVRKRARRILCALMEAFYKRVPVLAWAQTAVPDDGRRRRASTTGPILRKWRR